MNSTPRSKRDANRETSVEDEDDEEYPDYDDDENPEEYVARARALMTFFNSIFVFRFQLDSQRNPLRNSKLTSIRTGTIMATTRYVPFIREINSSLERLNETLNNYQICRDEDSVVYATLCKM